MEKKYYQIVAKTAEDWSVVHKLLMQDGTLEDNIPSRSLECVKEIPHSPTRSTYLMTDEESEILRNDPRINCINLDPDYHENVIPKSSLSVLKYPTAVRNYRALKVSNDGINYTQAPPVGLYDGATSGEFYRTGYQILRSAQKNNPWPPNPNTVLNQNVEYNYDGTDIDVIVVDNGVFFGHPEFTYDEYTPPNYIRGNVLSRSGTCGVLDLVLDAPYYLDPQWFDASPSTRLERRWDGTLVPKESVAREWWDGGSSGAGYKRSSGYPDFGRIVIPNDYTRANHCGANRTTPPATTAAGDHGTPCASLTYGKNFGWAFNANKWAISKDFTGATGGVNDETVFDIQKIFHQNKPNNPKFGSKNPTVSSNSWELFSSVPIGGGFYSYQGGDAVRTESLTDVSFLQTKRIENRYPIFIRDDTTYIEAGRELVDSGVIVVVAAGNNGRYLASPTDPNFNNYFVADGSSLGTRYLNRPGYPSQIGYRNGETAYKTFIIGAIDDEYTGAFSSGGGETNSTYLAAGSGKERLARSGETRSATDGDYTNRGTGVDFYSPGDGNLSASHATNVVTTPFADQYQNPYQISTTARFNDRYFNGTSSACPVAAGLIACLIQNNRNLSPLNLKTYLRNNIEDQTNFFTGIAPTSATDTNWHRVPYNTMGTPVKILYQFTTTTTTPNPTFTPTYGISSSERVNERFTITHNAADRNTLGIYGIQMFSSSISNGTSITLEIRNGYYLVGSNNRVNASGGPATDSDGTQFGRLDRIAIRVDPTNNKRVQLSDSNGADAWNNMEITVLNGTFQKVGTQIYYFYNGITSPTLPTAPTTTASASSGTASIASVPTITSGTPGSIVGATLTVTGAGEISAGGNIFAFVSDERLKGNQKCIENALDKVEKLNGFTYNFNETGEKIGFDPNKRHSGVSAQDVQEVLPEAVAPAPADNNYLTVKYDKLIPLLIESIKDLKNDIDDLKDNYNK